MINSNKLIPRRSSGNSLNLTATSDLNVVRGTVVKIDNILKERLVLSKVREGIIRQQEERRIRSRRETLLERDDVKNNYSVDDEDKIKKPKSGLGGLLGSVFKGILGSLGSVAFGLTPSLLGVGLLVRKLTNPFLAITGVAFATLNVVVSKSGSQFKEIERKVNKSDISESKILGGAQSVVDALLQATAIFVGGTLAGRGVRRAIGGRTFSARELIAQKELSRRNARRATLREQFEIRKARIDAIDPKLTPEKQERIFRKIVKKTTTDADRINRFENAEADQLIREAELDKRALAELDRTGGRGVRRGGRALTGGSGIYKIDEFTDPTEFEEILQKYKRDSKKRRSTSILKPRGRPRSTARPPKIREEFLDLLRTQQETREVKAAAKTKRLKIENVLDQFEDVDFDDPEFLKLDAEMKAGRGPKPPRLKSSPAMRRGMMGQQLGLSRMLDRGMLRVGGRKLAKSAFGKGAKSIIRSSVSGIPLIGDLIALLLDVFVFGEPVGRAAFMAVGSIIGGIIGGVAGLVAGPVGALIGGLVGSVGGDLLGAAFYDLIFRRGGVDVGSRFGNAITRGGIKAGISGALKAGGFANYGKYLLGEAGTEFVLDADSTAAIEDKYPGFLMALNKSDGAGAIDLIREYASYETEGRVDFIPIPIPSVTNSDPQVIVINSQPKDKRLYSQHYRRG